MKRILAGALALSLVAGAGAASAQDRGHDDHGRGGGDHHQGGGGGHGQRGGGFAQRGSVQRGFNGGSRGGFVAQNRGGFVQRGVNPGFRGPSSRGSSFRGGYASARGYGYRGYNGGYRHEWRRGGYWPRGYGYFISDPWDYNLYDAPYGYRWVRDDYGDLVLISIATGLIAEVANGGY